MSSAASDRNLLFGVLALQMDFVPRDALLAAMNAWVLDKARPLGEILVAQGALQAAKRNLLDSLVDAHLEIHGHDADKSLAAVPLSTPLRRELQGLTDPDVQASLSRMPTPSAGAEPGLLTTTTAEIHRQGGLRYHVLRPHDKGGIGEVFVALDQELNREVALKEIQEQHAGDAPSVGRFVREAEITGGLEHPGIVPVYGLGQYGDGRPYYAMRFIRGETLKDAIGKYHAGQTAWTLRALLMRFVTVCNTLAYAHSRGVIHRDVKPANIMLGQYGETLVVDWGMAKAVGDEQARSANDGLPEPTLVPRLADSIETQAGSAMGTPVYMSPEQASGRLDLLGPASDIYSLGATLYTLLTGQPPIEGKDIAEVLRKAQKGEWLPVRQVKPDVPPALAAICHKAMALAPAARYGTALELAADVEHWLADEPVAAYRESWLERSRRWRRHHRTLVSTVGGVLLIALFSAAVGLVLLGEAWDKESAARKVAEGKEEEARKQKERARLNQYAAQLNLVQRDYEANNIRRVRELLAAQVPQETEETDHRGFEWHYWHRLTHQELLILRGHAKAVASVAFRPDGRRLASAGLDDTVRVWDAVSGKELLAFKVDTTYRVAYSPDGRRLATGGIDGMVRVWDAETGQELFTLKGHAKAVTVVAFSPDGQRLASGSHDQTVRIWDAASRQELSVLKGHANPVWEISFSPDGRRLASASFDSVRVWNTATGKELWTVKGQSTLLIQGVAFSPDGRRLATAYRDPAGQVFDAETGKALVTLRGSSGSISGVAYSPNGRRLASAGHDRNVHIWDAGSGQELFTLTGHTAYIRRLAFSPDGRRLASASEDGTVRVWDAACGAEPLQIRGRLGAVWGVAYSPDGRRLAAASGPTVAARREGALIVFDAATGQPLLPFKDHTGPVTGVAYSPDGRQLASAGDDQTARIWDAATGQELLTLNGHGGPVKGVAYSPDGRRLATASGDQTVRVWDTATGQQLLNLGRTTVGFSGVAFSPDGRKLAACSPEGIVCSWETAALPDAVGRRRELVSLVHDLFMPRPLREKVQAALRRDTTLDEEDRKFALAIVQSHLENPARMNQIAWIVVRLPDADRAAYAEALDYAEAAVHLAPEDSNLLNTLGVAQYRVGRHADALATLTKSEKLNATKEGSQPADLAFLAMTQHQLGKKSEAKTALGRLREVMKQPRWAQDGEAAGFLREAEELIEGGASKKP